MMVVNGFAQSPLNHPGLLASTFLDQNMEQVKNARIPWIKNIGQQHEDVGYYAQTFAGTVFISNKGEILYSIPIKGSGSFTMSELFIRGNQEGLKKIKINGEVQSITKVNYFIGNNPEKWKSNVPTYQSLHMGEVWPGVQVKLKAHGNNVEKLFYIAPNADPATIRIQLAGIDDIVLNELGELLINTTEGNLSFSRPIAFQYINGIKHLVHVDYNIDYNAYGFIVNNYDPAYELVIDPLIASTFIGGSHWDFVSDLFIDNTGNIFITGYTYSPDFPVTGLPYSGNSDIFVSIFNNDLDNLIASTFLGGSNDDGGYSMTVGSGGNLFITGETLSADFPTTSGCYDDSYNGGQDAFISKLSNDLSTLISSTYIGGSANDISYSISLGLLGKVFITGETMSSYFPTILGSYNTSSNGLKDAFISKFSNDLTSLEASTYVGGSGVDHSYSVKLDIFGNVFIGGTTESYNFPATVGSISISLNGPNDIFIAKLDNGLGSVIAATYVGGTQFESISEIKLGGQQNVILIGYSESSDYPTTPGCYSQVFNGGKDVVISKISNDLTTLLGSTFLGGSNIEFGESIEFDSNGNIYITGTTGSADFPTTPNSYCPSGGGVDGYISKLSPNFDILLASTYIGGIDEDYSVAIDLDPNGDLIITGTTGSSDYPTTTNAYDETFNAGWDVFISKLDTCLSGPAGVNLRILNEKIIVYPVPANDVLYVDYQKPLLIKIYDLLNREILISTNKKMDISNLSPGIYLLIIENEEGITIQSQKIVIE